MSVNLKPSCSTEERITGTVASKQLLSRMFPCGVTNRNDAERFGTDVVDVADHFVRRKLFVELIGRADVALEQLFGGLCGQRARAARGR